VEAHLKDFKKRIRPRPPFLAAHVLSVFLLLPGLILMLTAMATAQVGSASRSGVVQDQCSAAVPAGECFERVSPSGQVERSRKFLLRRSFTTGFGEETFGRVTKPALIEASFLRNE
jgi:hypothetical protein